MPWVRYSGAAAPYRTKHFTQPFYDVVQQQRYRLTAAIPGCVDSRPVPKKFHIFASVPPFFCPAVRPMLRHRDFADGGKSSWRSQQWY
jgi:hypothetical protein